MAASRALVDDAPGDGEGAADADERIGDDGDGDLVEPAREAALLPERGEERVAVGGDDEAPDVADDEHAARGELAEGEVARFGAVERSEQSEDFGGRSRGARETELGDGGVAIALGEPPRDG